MKTKVCEYCDGKGYLIAVTAPDSRFARNIKYKIPCPGCVK